MLIRMLSHLGDQDVGHQHGRVRDGLGPHLLGIQNSDSNQTKGFKNQLSIISDTRRTEEPKKPTKTY